MKNKTVLIIICVVLGIALVSGTTYLVTKNFLNNENSNKTLSEEELMKYVRYVPVQEHITDDFYSGPNAYKANSDNVTQIDKKALVLQILVNIEYPSYDKRNATFEEVEKYLHEMYNVDMKSVNLDPFYVDPGLTGQDGKWYYIENGFFDGNGDNLGDIGTPIHVIEKYDVKNDELHIYERTSKCDGFPYPVMTDHNKGLVKSFEDEFYESLENNNDVDISCERYLKENKNEFTLYKDTFKKNDTGYYWYSTEIVK